MRVDKKVKNIISALLFFVLISFVLVSVTYLMRGNRYSYDDRITVAGLKEEAKNSLDVIYIGGSAAFTYYEPLKTFSDHGFASYDLATNNMQAEAILSYVRYAQKYQDPSLYVIGVRAFQYYSETGDEYALRIASDALDIGINRFSLVHDYLSDREMDAEPAALYWDIMKYHTNYEAFSTGQAWDLMDNSIVCDNKGGRIGSDHYYLNEPRDFDTKERAVLEAGCEKTLRKLLKYLSDNHLEALFVVCPYMITKEHYAIYNSIQDIVNEYGYSFLNTNDHYTEMNIDYAQDFSDVNHVNAVGAEKYTEFLEKYIIDNYKVPDHRGEAAYSRWEALAEEYKESSREMRNEVYDTIAYRKEGLEQRRLIEAETDPTLWSELINDQRYTCIVVGNGTALSGLGNIWKKTLGRLGFPDDLYETPNFMGGYCGGKELFTNGPGEKKMQVQILNRGETSCDIDNEGGRGSIVINDVEYRLKSDEGIDVVIFDNTYREMIDAVALTCDKNGELVISR